MFFFKGEKCPVCDKEFEPADDVVTCPECGAPYHRECYKSGGGCMFEDKHAEGFEWERTATPEDDEKPENELRCPTCGAKNLPGAQVCENCMTPIVKSDEAETHRETNGEYDSIGTTFVVTDGELIDGVPVGDLKRFVGSMWLYYLPFFYGVARGVRKIAFNLPALFMHGIWFISRKMYGRGILMLTAMLGTLACQEYYSDTVMKYYELMKSGDSTAGMKMVTEQPVMTVVLFAAAIIRYGILIYSALWGSRAYMKYSVKKIKKINKKSKTADEFNNRLSSSGGVGFLETLVAMIAYIGTQYYITSVLFK